jgi:hypothetical protein
MIAMDSNHITMRTQSTHATSRETVPHLSDIEVKEKLGSGNYGEGMCLFIFFDYFSLSWGMESFNSSSSEISQR